MDLLANFWVRSSVVSNLRSETEGPNSSLTASYV